MAPSIFGNEGFTVDTIVRVLRDTAFNPVATVPLYLACLYSYGGRSAAVRSSKAFVWLEQLAALSALRKINAFLNKGTLNNWVGDTYNWQKEVVLITGGSDGIGARVVQMLSAKGITIVVLDIQPLQFEAASSVHYFQCDLANPASIESAAAIVRSKVGNPTVLINNAGVVRGKTILDTSQADLSLTFDVNAKAHYYLVQQFLPHMIEHNHGMVVTIASVAAYAAGPRLVDYAASKAAALAFHEGLQGELKFVYKAPKVRTVVVCPTYTKTALFQGFDRGNGFSVYPLEIDTVAGAVVRAVLRGRSDHIVLPESLNLICAVRNWPWWMGILARDGMRNVMSKWHGRQVSQPSEMEITGIMDSDFLVEK